MSIAEIVKFKREEKKLSQRKLASMVGIDPSMINMIERGTRVPSLPVSNGLAKALECTLDELAGNEVENKNK